jgi:multidrug efflux pump subunit AcrA (membrane-fusion protein)
MDAIKRVWNNHTKTVAAVLAIVVAAGGVLGFKHYKKPAADDDAGTATVAKGDIELHFTDSGELTPQRGVYIASKVSGRIIELGVAEGARVKKGDKLVTVQPGRTEAEAYIPTPVLSPLDGVVLRYQKEDTFNQEASQFVRIGDYVTGLMESTQPTYLMTIADLSHLVVKMKISEMDILKLKEGMQVNVTVEALGKEPIPAKVTLISPQAEKDRNDLKSFKVEVSLLKVDPRLKPGMTARVDGLLESRKQVLKLPLSAVFEEGQDSVAYLSDAKGKPKRVVVKLGLRNETDAEVTSGLKEGDKLMTEKPHEEKKS